MSFNPKDVRFIVKQVTQTLSETDNKGGLKSSFEYACKRCDVLFANAEQYPRLTHWYFYIVDSVTGQEFHRNAKGQYVLKEAGSNADLTNITGFADGPMQRALTTAADAGAIKSSLTPAGCNAQFTNTRGVVVFVNLNDVWSHAGPHLEAADAEYLYGFSMVPVQGVTR